MNGIRIESPGMLTTLQDAGRIGTQKYGVSPAGPMDERSFAIANLLVGAPEDSCLLEATCMGPKLMIGSETVLAVTGGDLSPAINGNPIPMYQAIRAHAGDELSLGTVHGAGSRSYIAFAGGLNAPVIMGSRATLMRNHIGGLHGTSLKSGDEVEFLNPEAWHEISDISKRSIEAERFDQNECVLRVVPGPQASEFTRKGFRHFFWYPFTISEQFDRMGCRLRREEAVEHLGDGNIITDGIAFGSIQVPPNGQPIIMLADRQSTGGYAKIGTVISVDIPKLVQCMPGATVRFIEVDVDLAQTLYIRQKQRLNELQKLWKGSNHY